MTEVSIARSDALDKFIDHIACTEIGDEEGEALFFTRRMPAGFIPLRGYPHLSDNDRANVLLAFIGMKNTDTLERNVPYSLPLLIREGDRAFNEFVQSIIHNDKFIHKLAEKIAESMQERGTVVPA